MSSSRRALLGALGLCVLPLLGFSCTNSKSSSGDTAPGPAAAPGGDPDHLMRSAGLYFPGNDGRLYVETRSIADFEAPVDRLIAVVEAYLAGPETAGLRSPFADGVEVDGLFLLGDGIVALNLRSADGGPPASTGSRREMLIVYSLVNTVILDLAGAERLLLTWNGRQPSSFAGQLDTTHPLRPNLDLVAG